MNKNNRITLEAHTSDVLKCLHLYSLEVLYELLKEYDSYNSGLGCYDEMIAKIKEEIKKR